MLAGGESEALGWVVHPAISLFAGAVFSGGVGPAEPDPAIVPAGDAARPYQPVIQAGRSVTDPAADDYCVADRLDALDRLVWGVAPPPLAPGRREAIARVRRMARDNTVYDDRLVMLGGRHPLCTLGDRAQGLRRAGLVGGGSIQVTLTHEQIAALVGTSRETATKALGAFAEQGLAKLGRGKVVIIDRARLADEAGEQQ
jgi:hypothetical protein